MGKKHAEDPPAGAPEWIVTFSDMVSLLVTFFVMLMSFSTMDEKNTMVIRQAFSNSAGGVLLNLNGPSMADPPPVDHMNAVHPLRGAVAPHSRPTQELLDNLLEMGQRKGDDELEVDLNKMQDGLVVGFHDDAGFAPGSFEISPALARSLREFARVAKYYPYRLVVEGYTDDAFQPTERHATAEELSVARASAAAAVLIDECPQLRSYVQLSGLGSRHPRAGNETAEARAHNRRVEIRLLSLSEARAAQFRRERDAETERRD
jgi:chemotaxis protein MotB